MFIFPVKNKKLILDQLDRKILQMNIPDSFVVPPAGWINSIRQALGMTLRQTKGYIAP